MEFTAETLMAIASIIMIDLVLAGDNAVVIALASCRLSPEHRKKAIYFGALGAIVIRFAMTAAAVWLMKIPYLQAIGGIILIPVAIKLLVKDTANDADIQAGETLLQAIKTIIFADVVMGVDNVLAIAGASHGNMLLVIFGLLVSVPIVIWGSKFLCEWLARYPFLTYVGAGILAWTAGSMIIGDKLFGPYLQAIWSPISLVLPGILVAVTIIVGWLRNRDAAVAE